METSGALMVAFSNRNNIREESLTMPFKNSIFIIKRFL